MKIGPLDNKAITPAVTERRASSDTPVGGAEPSAKVALSHAASQLVTGGNDGTFDASKVKRISQAIRDGKFEINAGAIADKLISNAHELLGVTRKS